MRVRTDKSETEAKLVAVTALIDLTYEGEGTHKSCKNSSFVWPCSSFFFFQVTTSTHPLGTQQL